MKDYKITILSTIDGQTSEVIVYGNVYKEYGSTVVYYNEGESNDPTKIVIADEVITIAREGEMNTLLTFEKDKTYSSTLDTEYGSIDIEMKTLDLYSAEKDRGVEMGIEYLTQIAGLESRFSISVRAEKVLQEDLADEPKS